MMASRRRVLDLAIPYAAAAVPFTLTVAIRGTWVLAFDDDPLQHWEAVLFFWLGVEVFRFEPLSLWERHLFAAGGAWLAVDERLMVHECFHWKFRLPGPIHDPLVVFYALAGTAIAVRVLVVHPNRPRMFVHGLIAMAAAVISAAADGGFIGRQNTPFELVVEEGGEFLAISSAIALLRAPDRRIRLTHALAWTGFSLLWMGASVWLVRPWLCPARLL